MKTAPDDRLYRPNVGIILLNTHKKIFIGQRYDARHKPVEKAAWQMPQGGIDEGESVRAAAMRELLEEIGTHKAEIMMESKDWYYYDLPPHLQKRLWGGRFLGQRQKWVIMQFTGEEYDIALNTPHPEFCAMQWATPQEVLSRIVPFKRSVYERVLEDFREWF